MDEMMNEDAWLDAAYEDQHGYEDEDNGMTCDYYEDEDDE